jgi:FKBP-type peptidyl-prolyl cis-trans isomerase
MRVVFLLACSLAAAAGKACQGDDLPADTKLRVGSKFKPEGCKDGRISKPGDKLSMHYTGKLYKDCTKFDSSHDRDEPFDFKLGAGQVIKGWDEGLRGMCVGEKRKLTIGSDMGYGSEGSPPNIHGGATLQFEVELLSIKDGIKKRGDRKKAKKKKSKKAKDEL